jgi:U3 small nucleolar RNA-associated protein 18
MGIVGTSKKGGGIITILDGTTMQWISQVRIDSRGGVSDFAWWSDGEGLCVVGKSGEVSEWDIREKRVVATWVDEGAVGTTVLNLGGSSGCKALGGDRWVAVGSSSGIVNIYDRRPWQLATIAAQKEKGSTLGGDEQRGVPRHPKPKRMLDQLTTPVSHIVFANDGQFLVIASRWKRDALRLGMWRFLPSCPLLSES